MVPADPAADAREALRDALRDAVPGSSVAGPEATERLAALLGGREAFAATAGDRPGGQVASLPPPFDGLVAPDSLECALADLRETLETTGVDPGSIGAAYEGSLDAGTRGDRGQFFTPEPVAAALVEWALGGRDAGAEPPRLLDPAAGTGTFLVAGFERLTAGYPDRDPARLLDRCVGVDIDAGALHLAGLRLAATADIPAPERLALHHASFFDCEPAGGPGSRDADAALRRVDAVVGNPPFIRAENLSPDPDHFRDHLGTFGPPTETALRDGSRALSRRSDAYVYFVTQATRFLRPGGRLAFVLPTKWLMSEYGEDLRRFLRARFHVHAIVGFDVRAFGDALVDTVLLLAERRDDPPPDGSMQFARVAQPSDTAGLLSALSAGADAPDAGMQVVDRTQDDLTASASLARYLEAPAELLSLFVGEPFVRLDALAEVARGTMTGANRFFFVDDPTVTEYGIGSRFLRPAVKSLRSVDRPTVDDGAIERWLVDVHPFARAVRASLDDGADPAAAVKAALAGRHGGLAAYIDHAEASGWHTGRTCQARSVWFDLGPLRAPAAFVPKLLRERVFTVRNAAGAVPSNAIDGIWPAEVVDAGALLAVLNASVGQAAMEITGRDEAGMLQLMTYETASLPTLDVRRLSPTHTRALIRANETYARAPGRDTLRGLDGAVHTAFDLPMSAASLREHASTLRRQRVAGGETVAEPAD